jgi:hypothetical protein
LSQKKTFKHYDVFREPRNRTIKALNNTHVLTSLTGKSLRALHRTISRGEEEPEQEYEVPSSGGETIALSRDRVEIMRLLSTAFISGIHEQAIIAAVALTEAYLQRTLKTVLRWFPQKLKQNISGERTDKTVSLDVILSSKNRNQIVSKIINKQLQGIFYGAPSRYFEYIEAVLSIELPATLKEKFIEIKATRDLIVHNSGKVNETYLEKAGKLARGENGEKLPMDAVYFAGTVANLKKLVIVLDKQVLGKYGNAAIPTK